MPDNPDVRRIIFLVLLAAAPAAAEQTGECRFDPDTLSFAGTAAEQAACLLRKVEVLGKRKAQPLPPLFARLLDGEALPSAAMMQTALAAFPQPYQDYARIYAAAPLSRTASGLPALYFVIHDTSTPFYADQPFPKRLDTDWQINSFAPYMDGTFAREPVAHIFLSRYGQIWAGHEFQEGWRATKLESRAIGPASRGRFIHIETVQPRRLIAGFTDTGHTHGPEPGFSAAQYRQLAALYVYTSARAGRWLIPAQHNTVDAGIPDAHDDPQNFDLGRFAEEIEAIISPG
ncbi:N-acetylmuramoyl-L-alanine amidase [Novosphingobium sp.]|uniref:peptidoglycan recognition protein family protein n=1 Tax=Novosphingobium sp. TaxID=1874826 RepID=UPI0025EA5D26|nr:N-acetylmuramoyl-L-alanine amidase [Novosphingobium sp.]